MYPEYNPSKWTRAITRAQRRKKIKFSIALMISKENNAKELARIFSVKWLQVRPYYGIMKVQVYS